MYSDKAKKKTKKHQGESANTKNHSIQNKKKINNPETQGWLQKLVYWLGKRYAGVQSN